jgi:hypothetical protein
MEVMELIGMMKKRRPLEGVEYKPRNEMVTIKMMVMVMASPTARYRKWICLPSYPKQPPCTGSFL